MALKSGAGLSMMVFMSDGFGMFEVEGASPPMSDDAVILKTPAIDAPPGVGQICSRVRS
jgi:hypothetical protein